MQDWNYEGTSCMEITVELSDIKYPNANTLDVYWQQNKYALLSYMEQVHSGVRGQVKSNTGNPLTATITVQNNSHKVFTDFQFGDYYRLLRPGTYSITASSAGYQSQTKSVTILANQQIFETVEINFELSPN